MSKTIVRPTLSLGNHIYLYRLLRDAIGCGKQTFMTQVEEALAAGDMAAYDLGFESTRELLEELDDCIKLTVFKGGRCMPPSSPTRHGMPPLPRTRTSASYQGRQAVLQKEEARQEGPEGRAPQAR